MAFFMCVKSKGCPTTRSDRPSTRNSQSLSRSPSIVRLKLILGQQPYQGDNSHSVFPAYPTTERLCWNFQSVIGTGWWIQSLSTQKLNLLLLYLLKTKIIQRKIEGRTPTTTPIIKVPIRHAQVRRRHIWASPCNSWIRFSWCSSLVFASAHSSSYFFIKSSLLTSSGREHLMQPLHCFSFVYLILYSMASPLRTGRLMSSYRMFVSYTKKGL